MAFELHRVGTAIEALPESISTLSDISAGISGMENRLDDIADSIDELSQDPSDDNGDFSPAVNRVASPDRAALAPRTGGPARRPIQ